MLVLLISETHLLLLFSIQLFLLNDAILGKSNESVFLQRVNVNMNLVYYFIVYAEFLYTIIRYRTYNDYTRWRLLVPSLINVPGSSCY